jgi:hypothetical protein
VKLTVFQISQQTTDEDAGSREKIRIQDGIFVSYKSMTYIIYGLQSTVYGLRSTVYGLRSTVNGLSTVYGLRYIWGGGRFVTSPPVGDNFYTHTRRYVTHRSLHHFFGQKKCSANFCSVTGNSVGSGCESLFLVFYIFNGDEEGISPNYRNRRQVCQHISITHHCIL